MTDEQVLETDHLLRQAFRQEMGMVVQSGAIGFLIAAFSIVAGPASAAAVAIGMAMAAVAYRP